MLDNIRKLFASRTSQPKAAEIEAALEATDQAMAALRQELPELRKKVVAAALRSEAEGQKARAALREIETRLAEYDDVRSGIVERLEQAQAYEAQAERQARYTAAQAKIADTERAFRQKYPRLRKELLVLLREVFDAELAAKRANTDLPAGAPPLADALAFRDRPGAPRKVLGERVERVWVDAQTRQPVKASAKDRAGKGLAHQDGIIKWEDTSPTTAIYTVHERHHNGSTQQIRKRAELVDLVSQRVAESVPGRHAEGLGCIRLPGLHWFEPRFEFVTSAMGVDAETAIDAIDRALERSVEPEAEAPHVRETVTEVRPSVPAEAAE